MGMIKPYRYKKILRTQNGTTLGTTNRADLSQDGLGRDGTNHEELDQVDVACNGMNNTEMCYDGRSTRAATKGVSGSVPYSCRTVLQQARNEVRYGRGSCRVRLYGTVPFKVAGRQKTLVRVPHNCMLSIVPLCRITVHQYGASVPVRRGVRYARGRTRPHHP